MTVTQRRYAKGAVIVLAGHLDSVTSNAALAACEQFTEAAAPLFVFECSELNYVSSAGLRVFLEIAKRVKTRHRAKVAITGLSPMVQEIFEISGFGTLFAIHPALARLDLGAAIE